MMNKKTYIFFSIIALILIVIFYENNNTIFKIKENKISQVLYVTKIGDKQMGQFDVTDSLNENDKIAIVHSLNNGILKPDKEEVGKYTLEYIEILVLNDRWFRIYKQKNGNVTVMYTLVPGSNSQKDYKQTTINSKELQCYFTKFEEKFKSLTPNHTWSLYY